MVLQGAIRVTAVLQGDVVGCHYGPPRRLWWRSVTVGCRCGTSLVLQRNTVGPPKGHRCRIVTWVSLWSSKGTLLVLQRVSSVTVVLQGGIVGPPKGQQCHCGPPAGHCWSSKGTLVSYCHHWVCQTWSSKGRTLLVLQRDVDCHWSSKGTLLVLQRGFGCQCGPPTGRCWSSKGTSVSRRHCWVSPWSSKGA